MADIEIQIDDKKTIQPHFASEGELRRAIIAAYEYGEDSSAYDNRAVLHSGKTLDGRSYPWYLRLQADMIGFMNEYYKDLYEYYIDLFDMEPLGFIKSVIQPAKDEKWKIVSDDFLRSFMTSHYWKSQFSPESARRIRGGKRVTMSAGGIVGGDPDIQRIVVPNKMLRDISRRTLMPEKRISLHDLNSAVFGQRKINSRKDKLKSLFNKMSMDEKDSNMKRLYERVVFYRRPFDYAFKKFGTDAPSALLASHVMDKVMKGKPHGAVKTITDHLFKSLDKSFESLSDDDKSAAYRELLENDNMILGVAGLVDNVLSTADKKLGKNFANNVISMRDQVRDSGVTGGKKHKQSGGTTKLKLAHRMHM